MPSIIIVCVNKVLIAQIEELLKEEDKLSSLCNVASAIFYNVENINWAGFYFYKNGKLQLGPFQGKVACTSIEIGKGVCGSAYKRKMLLNVNDVHKFAGHIACDPESNSELVVPLIYENKILGVLDIDSQFYRRFGNEEEETMEEIAKLVAKKLAAK